MLSGVRFDGGARRSGLGSFNCVEYLGSVRIGRGGLSAESRLGGLLCHRVDVSRSLFSFLRASSVSRAMRGVLGSVLVRFGKSQACVFRVLPREGVRDYVCRIATRGISGRRRFLRGLPVGRVS